jgi:4-hydroxybenzoate polyprenyltransferase
MLITLHICYLLNNYWIFLWVMIGTFFGLGYSLKPFHFKVRGPLHATLALSALFTPFVFLYYVIAGMPPAPTIIIILALATIHYGFALVNQSQDYIEDKASNLRTPAVRWGLTRTLRIAFTLAFLGLCIYFIGLYLLFSLIPGFSLFGYTLSLELVFALVTVSLALGYFVPMRGLRDLIKISLSTQEIEQKMTLINKRLNYPRWQFCGLLGSMIVALLYFVL